MMSEKNYNFQKLTPIKNTELKIYDDALNFVFDDDNIKNVAISGAYSAGKSSMIETYKNAHPEIRCLHISLAHFESTESSNGNSTEYSEAVLEGKILNQLIHQIHPDKIKQTNFKVKQKVSVFKIIINTAIVTSYLILVAYIGFFSDWCNYVSTLTLEWLKKTLMWTTNSSILMLSGLLCVAIFGLATYTIITTQKNKNIFRKVNLQGNEIEIFEENDDSYFDKYLNEVMYLFENSDADVIVFEDMDRYNVNQIFEKLREINTLVNNKNKKEKKPLIRFFYLLRDDIFVSKDRTKFFDFIVPIVPVIDGSNSYNKFIEYFELGGIFELFDKSFLQGLSLYVDDMRILKNIYNEFVIYRNRIESTELNSNKLLAIIAYKNIFPRDFGNLQIGMGFVHTLFESKPSFIEQEIHKIELKIQRTEENIQLANDEIFASIDELDTAFLPTNLQIYTVAGNGVSTFKTRVELVKAMKDNPNSVQYYNNGPRPIDMTSEFASLLHNTEYVNRKQAIEIKTQNRIEALKVDIQQLQHQKSIVQNSRLQDIIKKENIDTIFSVIFTNEIGEKNIFAEIKASSYFALIKYLVRNGFIDETYPDYMTYFYENSLSRIDKIFLRSVTDETPKEYDYSLKDPKLVFSRLRLVDFDHVEILNFDLLCYILKTKQDDVTFLTRLFQQLKETKNFKFIGQFLDIRRETNLFLESMNHLWSNVWKCILDESDFSNEQKKQYVIDTLYFSPKADIESLNKNRWLTAFISGTSTFLDIDKPNVNSIIDGFTLLDVQFAWIDYGSSNKDLFNAVYSNNLYQLTFDLISLILEKIYKLTKGDDFKSKTYTLISSKQNEPLAQYVNENINHFIIIVLENCDKFINDEEFVALIILNNMEVNTDNKEEYISLLQTVIECIENVTNKEIWSLLLLQKRVKYSVDNILSYYFYSEKGLDSSLVQFVNSNNGDLNFDYEFINNKFGDNSASEFYKAIITCGELLDEKYHMILLSLNMVYESFIYKEIQGEKIIILIKLGFILMTDENLSFMRENYPEQLVPFIIKNIYKYTKKIINDKNYNLDEILLVLNENVADRYKINLLQYVTDKISVQKKKYSDAVKKHILEYNMDVSDISFLFKTFSDESDDVKEIIKNASVEHITEIIAEEYLIPFELLTELLETKELSAVTKKELFTLCLPNMNEVRAKEYLQILHMGDFLSLFDQKRPKIEINSTNEQILTIFQKKNWITRFDVDKDDPNYYRANGRKFFGFKLPVELL